MCIKIRISLPRDHGSVKLYAAGMAVRRRLAGRDRSGGMCMRRFFIDPLASGQTQAAIRGADAAHIRRVLRLTAGERVILVDGSGWEFAAVIRRLGPDRVDLDVLERAAGRSESPLAMVLAQAFLKDRKMDDLIRPLTELGVTEWVAFPARRSVAVPHAARLEERLARWERLAREAVKQCGRVRVPAVRAVESLEAVLAEGVACDRRLFFWEDARDRPLAAGSGAVEAPAARILAVVGPEGGFTPEEAAAARRAGFTMAGLGPRVLRADTAALTVCALLQHRWGDLGGRLTE
jgi:16S rRNA (uracil1498-N3)-methyltransferase